VEFAEGSGVLRAVAMKESSAKTYTAEDGGEDGGEEKGRLENTVAGTAREHSHEAHEKRTRKTRSYKTYIRTEYQEE